MKLLLSRRDLQLSRQALALVVAVRCRLWRTPFAQLHAQWRDQVQRELDAALARGLVRDAEAAPDRASIDEVWNCSHAVQRSARLVPAASCLTQAMALQMMLARRGHRCDVRIGVERREAATETATGATHKGSHVAPANPLAHGSDIADGQFRAHAWVEWRGRVLIGGDVSHWKPLTTFAPVAPVAPPTSSTPS